MSGWCVCVCRCVCVRICVSRPLLPCVEVAVVSGDLPLGCAVVVVTAVVVAGAVVLAVVRWAWVVLVRAIRRPSGLVPYCTGWNNLRRHNVELKWTDQAKASNVFFIDGSNIRPIFSTSQAVMG